MATTGYAQSFIELDRPVESRYEATVVQYRGDIYAFNGFGPGIRIQNSVEKFDIATRQWSIIASTSVVGTAMTHNGIVRHGKDVWLIGGRLGNHPGKVSNRVWIFDLDTYLWREGPMLPVPVAAGGAALVTDKIHWFGGLDEDARCDSDRHLVYDLNEPTAGWQDISSVAAMPNARNHFSTVVLDGLIYAMGGQHGHDGCRTPTSEDVPLVHVFDPSSNEWRRLADLPVGQSHSEPGSFVYRGYIYIVGGKTLGDRVYRYDADTNEWDIVLTMPEKLLAPMARVVDDQLLVVSSGGGSDPVPVVRLYELEFLVKPDEVQGEPADMESDNTLDRIVLAGEVEHYDQRDEHSMAEWQFQSVEGASGGDAMVRVGAADSDKTDPLGPVRFDYLLYFDKPGEYKLWVRAKRRDGALSMQTSEHVYAAINDTPVSRAVQVSGFAQQWRWSSASASGTTALINVPSQGFHSLTLWPGDGLNASDKFVVTNDLAYQPTGVGPASFDGTGNGVEDVTNTDNLGEQDRSDANAESVQSSRGGGSAGVLLVLGMLLYLMARALQPTMVVGKLHLKC